MTNDRLMQIRQESESWKRLLEFIQSENTNIKTRIADIAAGSMDREMLARVEEFQQQCIRKDELVSTMRSDVYEFDRWLAEAFSENGSMLDGALEKQRLVRSTVKALSQQFHQLKFNFHDFVSENF